MKGEIRYYTSEVDPQDTAHDIADLLRKRGARRVTTLYDDGRPEAVEFVLQIQGEPMSFRLEPDVGGMHEALQDDEMAQSRHEGTSREQARRTAWRNLLGLVETALALRHARQFRLDQLLLGMGITASGETVYDRLVQDRQLLEK